MNWKRQVLLTSLLILSLCHPLQAAEPTAVIDAGLLEFGDGYLKVSDGFILTYEGKKIAGDGFLYNIGNGDYLLDEIGFTACIKEDPHYKILAKRLEIYPKERLIFSGMQVYIGKLKLAIPMRFVMMYRDGQYRFPEWLPELFFTAEKGVGVKVSGSYQPWPALETSGTISLSAKSALDVEFKSKFTLMKDVLLSTQFEYDKKWAGNFNLDWRTGLKGFSSKASWRLLTEGGDEKQVYAGYTLKGWRTGLTLTQLSTGELKPEFKVVVPTTKIGGMTHNLAAGVTMVTDKIAKKRHDKVYLVDLIVGQYSFGKSNFAVNFAPTHTWISGYGVEGRGALNLAGKFTLNSKWNLNAGYERVFRWGVALPEELSEYQPAEYVTAGFNYVNRNQLTEGWELGVQSKYSISNNRFESLQTSIVKAYDCFEIKADVELTKPSVNMGLILKY